MILAMALGAGCDPRQSEDEDANDVSHSKNELKAHEPIELATLSRREFTIEGVEDQVDYVQFLDDRRFVEKRKGVEMLRGDYSLTPDGRLCFITDGDAGSNCWRQTSSQSDGSLILEFNSTTRSIKLTPMRVKAQ